MANYTVRNGLVFILKTPVLDKNGKVVEIKETRIEGGQKVSDSDPGWELSTRDGAQMHKLEGWPPETEKREKPGHETRPLKASTTRGA